MPTATPNSGGVSGLVSSVVSGLSVSSLDPSFLPWVTSSVYSEQLST